MAILYFLLPFSPLLLQTQNGLHHITISFLPWVLLVFIKSVIQSKLKFDILVYLLIAFLVLIEVQILLSLIIGLIAVFIALRIEKEKLEFYLVKYFLIFLAAVALSSTWYSLRFWLILLKNPSFGGMPLINLIKYIYSLLLNLLPIFLALILIKFRQKNPSKAMLFGILFTISFLFLTIIRLLSDPDFIIDWIGYFLELQLGLSIILGLLITSLKPKIKLVSISSIIFLSLISGLFIFKSLINNTSWEFNQRIIKLLDIKNLKNQKERVFLSGSSVFWINSFLDISQVRGANDVSAINPVWADAAYQIREGEDAQIANLWLKALGTSYILVHDRTSLEPFKDFKHPEKFTTPGQSEKMLVNSLNGDSLYHLDRVSTARIASNEIFNVSKPINGLDEAALKQYSSTFKENIELSTNNPSQINLKTSLRPKEVISLAITYDPRWTVIDGKASLKADSFGNIVIQPKEPGEQSFRLEFKKSLFERLIPLFFSLLLLLLIIKYQMIYPFTEKLLSKLSLGLGEE